MSRPLIALLPILLLFGCQRPPQYVYVPEGEHRAEIAISISSPDIPVDGTVVLKARRSNFGDWKKVECRSLSDGECWVTQPPPATEEEVADNIRWILSPAGSADFNLQRKTDHTRTLTISQAGNYILKAKASTWCGADVRITPERIAIKVG